ncbi:recombinase RecT [Vibrio sp. 10N.239.312.D08]|uniref:recombinase RecT n=1 Tax=Vibrio sp. 10N.239.312.D08 TaxID=3229978 RepID=UPI00354C1AAB
MSVQATHDKITNELEIWKAFFPASDVYIKTVLDCARYWDDHNEGLRELFFFMCGATADSYRADGGLNDPYAPLNADLNSVRQGLYSLANIQGSFDPFLTTAYFKVRFDRRTGKYNLNIDLNYKGKVYLAKLNGLVKTVQPALVCEKDDFTYNGKNMAPDHRYPQLAALNDRGAVQGAYCVTTRPCGEVIVNFVNKTELDQLKNMAETTEIHQMWPAKMLMKSAINQAEKDWYSQEMSPVSMEKEPLTRIDNTKQMLQPFLNLCSDQGDSLTKLSKVVAYAMTFFTSEEKAREEGENMLMLLASTPDLQKCKPFSIAKALMASSKYDVSLSKSKEYTYITILKDKVHTAEIDLMYQGMREIAFSGITNTSQERVTKLEADLIYSNDRIVFEEDTKIPHVMVQDFDNRGALLGGFVVVTRGAEYEILFVNIETMEKVANCSRGNVKSTWPKQYARKTLLRQTFSSWL